MIFVPTYNFIKNMQRPDHLLNLINTSLGAINNLCRGHHRMWCGLILVMQYKCSSRGANLTGGGGGGGTI